MSAYRPLSETILAALKQACAEGHMDVADDLLRALEKLDGKQGGSTPLGEDRSGPPRLVPCTKSLKRAH